jgi:hypothetical protein
MKTLQKFALQPDYWTIVFLSVNESGTFKIR